MRMLCVWFYIRCTTVMTLEGRKKCPRKKLNKINPENRYNFVLSFPAANTDFQHACTHHTYNITLRNNLSCQENHKHISRYLTRLPNYIHCTSPKTGTCNILSPYTRLWVKHIVITVIFCPRRLVGLQSGRVFEELHQSKTNDVCTP